MSFRARAVPLAGLCLAGVLALGSLGCNNTLNPLCGSARPVPQSVRSRRVPSRSLKCSRELPSS